ncbi:MAG: Ig-like domain-containing protein, partial [Candidatus Thorarchaeota archaeon SMTZ1-83]
MKRYILLSVVIVTVLSLPLFVATSHHTSANSSYEALLQNHEDPSPESDSSIAGGVTPSILSGQETVFYGMADNETVRNIVGYADYIHVSHPYYNDGNDVKDNVRYLADHGVKVILQMGWWDVWPFIGNINGWEDMHKEDVLYGMNATETVKYRTRAMLNNIAPEYVWGIVISEEEPGESDFPWPFVAWYLNLFHDWLHEEFPGIKVFQFPSPHTFVLSPDYHVKADGIFFDCYAQELDYTQTIAAELKTGYPNVPLFFYISAAEHIGGWATCHSSTYTKTVVRAISPYVDAIGFWVTTDQSDEGWEVEHSGYKLALKLCNEIHLMDTNTLWGSTEWFYCDFGNDSMTDHLDHWYTSHFHSESPDPALSISYADEWQIGDTAINLTSVEAGEHSFWYQPLNHDYFFADGPGTGPYGPFNMTGASRITYWVKGIGWEDHPTARAYISIEKNNAGLGKLGNMTLPEFTTLLGDGQWHRVDLDLPLDPSMYYDWNGYGGQVRVIVDYQGSAVSNATSILLDGWEVQSFDTGRVYGISTSSDYTNATDGILHVVGDAYFETHFPQTDAWYYQYSGSGTIKMLINGSWTDPPDEGALCRWNVSAIRLASGTFDWIRVNVIPPIVDIVSPLEDALLNQIVDVQVSAIDESGIQRVDFSVDDALQYSDYAAPYSWSWDTTGIADGVHELKATAYGNNGTTNYHDIEVIIDNTKPTVDILAPSDNSLHNGTLAVSADADDASGIEGVEFYVDGALLATDSTAPYSFSWNTLQGSDGTRNLTCRAADSAGNWKSAYHSIIIDNTAPTIAVHSLVIGSDQTRVAVNVSDASSITGVEFYVEGSLEFTDSTYPYEWLWITSDWTDGEYHLQIVAYDSLGHQGFAQTGIVLDQTAPTLSVSTVPSGLIVADVVEVTASATDSSGIGAVEFYVDGMLQFSDSTSPFEWSWDTRLFSNGNHTLLVLASDEFGNTKYVASDIAVDNAPPVIVVNSPLNETSLEGPCTIAVQATALDTAGIDTIVLSYSTGSTWTNVTMVPNGIRYEASTEELQPGISVNVRIYANDTLGNSKWSAIWRYHVIDTTPPSLSVLLTPDNAIVRGMILIGATAADISGISMVIVYVDGSQKALLDSEPYEYVWDTSTVSDGLHTVSVWTNDTWNNTNFDQVSIETD